MSTGIITTIAGSGSAGYSGDNGAATSASLDIPYGVVIDSTGISSCYYSTYYRVDIHIPTKVTCTSRIQVITVSARLLSQQGSSLQSPGVARVAVIAVITVPPHLLD